MIIFRLGWPIIWMVLISSGPLVVLFFILRYASRGKNRIICSHSRLKSWNRLLVMPYMKDKVKRTEGPPARSRGSKTPRWVVLTFYKFQGNKNLRQIGQCWSATISPVSLDELTNNVNEGKGEREGVPWDSARPTWMLPFYLLTSYHKGIHTPRTILYYIIF